MPFTWSYSKKKNYDLCPKRHYEVDIAKHYHEESEQLAWGNRVHKALADACSGKATLTEEYADYQKWVDRIKSGPGELLVEQKYALTRDLQPCEYFGPRVWYRGIADIVRVDGPVALAVDWKTGKIQHDSIQLMLMAQCIFAFHKSVKKIKTLFVWLKDDCATPDEFNRDTIANEWVGLIDGVKQMEEASRTNTYEPKPNKLCARYCPVLSCPFHGKRHG